MNFSGVRTAYRLEIEGLGVEAVTDEALERSGSTSQFVDRGDGTGNDFTGWSISNVTVTADVDGAADLATEAAGGVVGYIALSGLTVPGPGQDLRFQIRMQQDADEGSFPAFHIRYSSPSDLITLQVNRNTGDYDVSQGTASHVSVTDGGDGYWDIDLRAPADAGGSGAVEVRVYPAYSTTLGASSDSAATGSVIIKGAQISDYAEIPRPARVVGLLRDGLQIEESCDIARAEIESSGMMVSVVDRQADDIWTQWLAGRPTTRTWLTSNVDTTGAAKLYVASATGFSADDVVHLGTEACLVNSVGSDGGGDYLDVLSADRGYWSTIAQHHFTQDGAELVRPVVTLTKPTTIEGRRARLYRYVLGEDDMQGDGTQIWMGLCSTDAKLTDGTTWSIQVDPITSLFTEDLASDLEEPLTVRGIHYPEDAPLTLIFGIDGSGTNVVEGELAPATISPLKRCKIRIVGFWESNDAFCEYLTPILKEAKNTSPDPAYPEIIEPMSSAANWSSIAARSNGDSWQIDFQALGDGGLAFDHYRENNAEGRVFVGSRSGTGAIGTSESITYRFPEAQLPRGMLGRSPTLPGGPDYGDDYSGADLYLDKPVAVDTDDLVTVTWSEESSQVYAVREVEDAENRVRLGGMYDAIAFSPAIGLPEIRVRRQYARGSLYDFLTTLASLAPQDANKGAQPFLVSGDMSLDSALFDEAVAGREVLGTREFASSAEVSLGDLITHECRLLSIFPHLDGQGRLTFSRLRLPTSTAVPDFEIDDSTRLEDSERPTWERNAFGSFNTVAIKTGYDLNEDDHLGPTFAVRDVTALSTRKNTRKLEIEPLSVDLTVRGSGSVYTISRQSAWTVDDAYTVASRVLGIFGRPYLTVRFEVPYTMATTALVGTVARVSFPNLPNTLTGVRGLSDVVGMVIGRTWALDLEERVQLTMVVIDEPIAGYAPSLSISTTKIVSGNEYQLTVSTMDPEGVASMAPPGVGPDDLFMVGDRVEVMEWDSATQTPQPGTVTDVTSTDLFVDFDAAPTLSGTRYVRFAAASDVAESQELFAFWGGSDARTDFASGAGPAQSWSG